MTYGKVIDFNQKVLHIEPRAPGPLGEDELDISFKCLYEEVDEFMDASISGKYVDQVDAILDSIYFAYGILYKLGITEDVFNQLFSLVHDANMKKTFGVNKKRDTGAADAVKPEGWVSPEKKMEEVIFGKSGQEDIKL